MATSVPLYRDDSFPWFCPQPTPGASRGTENTALVPTGEPPTPSVPSGCGRTGWPPGAVRPQDPARCCACNPSVSAGGPPAFSGPPSSLQMSTRGTRGGRGEALTLPPNPCTEGLLLPAQRGNPSLHSDGLAQWWQVCRASVQDSRHYRGLTLHGPNPTGLLCSSRPPGTSWSLGLVPTADNTHHHVLPCAGPGALWAPQCAERRGSWWGGLKLHTPLPSPPM